MWEAAVDLSHRFGDVSYAMLLDALSESRVLHRPRACSRRFNWLETVYDEENSRARDYRPNTLFLCGSGSARQLLERHPSCFCVALTSDDAVPSWVGERNFGNRVVLVRQRERFARYDSLLRALFVSNLIWENEMDRVVYAHGRLDKIIAVSEKMLRNFVCITDTGHNLIACSRGVEPPGGGLTATPPSSRTAATPPRRSPTSRGVSCRRPVPAASWWRPTLTSGTRTRRSTIRST